MTAVVFETPGLIDVRAFTIMGAHAKPNSGDNPIGYFGTGLKYAMAVLVRLGCEPVVWIGKDRVSFAKHFSKFRGVDLETIKMRVLKDGNVRPTYYELPYTTAYGKNWEAWQAYRELESNTLDENGATYLKAPDSETIGVESITRIVIDHPDFLKAYENRAETFLPGASRSGSAPIEVFDGDSEHIYYRTMRAMDLRKPSIFTYNIIEQQTLTEDRTLMYEFYIKRAVAKWVVTHANADQIERIVKAEESDWEFGLEFPSDVPPSEAFKEVMLHRKKPTDYVPPNPGPTTRPYIEGKISRNAHVYFAPTARAIRRSEPTVTIEAPWRLFDAHPRPWKVEGAEVVDQNGQAVFGTPEGFYDDWERTANEIIKKIGGVPIPG